MMDRVGYVYDSDMMRHKDPSDETHLKGGSSHPECPQRIESIYKELQKDKLLDNMSRIPSRHATVEEMELAHDNEYLNTLQKIISTQDQHQITSFVTKTYNSIYANKHTFNSALLAAGSTLDLVDNIINDTIDNGIAIVRPPGHHASKKSASGFCFLNNVAISAIHARNKGLKVAIVDFDVHYGDGTADIVGNEPNIEFFSVHRHDNGSFYPGTGNISSVANIHNYGFNLNKVGDSKYLALFKNTIIPLIKQFGPDLIIVSAGFDAGIGDVLGGYSVTPDGFASMTRGLKEVCPSIALVLEGGYNLTTISKSMAACTKVLLEKN